MKLSQTARWVVCIMTGVLLLPLVIHAVAALSTRPIADDYCYAVYARDYGLFGAIDYWYHTWTGIYSAIVLQGFVGLYQLEGLLPGVLLVLWFAATAWVMIQVAEMLHLPSPFLMGLAGAACLMFTIQAGSANIYQSLYWTAGAVGYTVPCMLLTVYGGVALHALRTGVAIPHLMLAAGLMMLNGGYSALFTVFQLAVLVFVGMVVIWRVPIERKRSMLLLIGISSVFALISLAIVATAPGNAIRQSNFGPPLALPIVIGLTIYGSLLFIPTSAGYLSPVAPVLTLVAFGAIALNFQPLTPSQQFFFYRHRLKLIGLLCLGGFALINASFLPAIYVFSDMPQARAYVVPQMVLMVTMAGCGYLMGLTLQRELRNKSPRLLRWAGWSILVLLLIAGPIRSAVQAWQMIPSLQTFASEWDHLNQQMQDLTTDGSIALEPAPFTVDLADLAEVTSTEAMQSGTCFKQYYKIGAVNS